MRHPLPIRRLLSALVVAGSLSGAIDGQQPSLRYDLQPGDHLVYAERLDRRATGAESEDQVVVEWESHVVVTGVCPGCVVAGTQRTRTSARLLRSVRDGRNVTAAEQKGFADLLATRSVVTADANWLDSAGLGMLPATVTREWRSLLLPGVREIEPLPAAGVAPGDKWAGRTLLGFQMAASACPAPAERDCLLLEGRSGPTRLRVWFSRAQRVVTKMSVTGDYDSPGSVRVHEDITYDLVERRRAERVDDWLASPVTRAGTLAALHISPSRPVPAERLYALLPGADAETERQVLAVAWQWHVAPPPTAVLERLLGSPNARVRTLAARLAGRGLEAPTGPPAAGVSTQRPTACAPEVERWSRARRLGREQPGATLRPMVSAGFEGWPYVVRIPDDYTGEFPVPVVIYLSGGVGVAVSGAQTAERALADTGYLAVFPHAGGLWWDERPGRMVQALIDEIVRAYRVDTNRIYLAGFSNGGTGSLIYGARWPDRFAAVVPTMAAAVGFGSVPAFLSGLNTVPLLLIHGTRDSIIPVDQAAENRKRLERQARTAPFDLVLLDGRPHDVNIGSDGGRTLTFIENRRRDPFPPSFVFETTDLASPRRYWLAIIAKDGGTARIEARRQPDGSIDVVARAVKAFRLLLRAELLPRDAPLIVRVNGRESFRERVDEDCALFARSLQQLSDPGLAYSAIVEVDLTGQTVKSRNARRSMPAPIASSASPSSSR